MNYPQQGYGQPQGYPPAPPGYGPPPQQGYAPPPQQGYAPPPQQGYQGYGNQGYGPPPAQQAPQEMLPRPTLRDYLTQPAMSGASINKAVFPQPGARVIVRVARPLGDADVGFQTDMNTGAIRKHPDGHPRLLLRVPVLVSHAAVPGGDGTLIMRGQMYEEAKRAMAEAGNDTGIPEAGAIMDITRMQDRPVQNRSAQHIFQVVYDRSQVTQHATAAGQNGAPAPDRPAQALAQAAAPDMAAMAQAQGEYFAQAGAPVGPGAPIGYQPPQAPPPPPAPQDQAQYVPPQGQYQAPQGPPQGPPQQPAFEGQGFGQGFGQPPQQAAPQMPPPPQPAAMPQAPYQQGPPDQPQYAQPAPPPPPAMPQGQPPFQPGPPQGQPAMAVPAGLDPKQASLLASLTGGQAQPPQ